MSFHFCITLLYISALLFFGLLAQGQGLLVTLKNLSGSSEPFTDSVPKIHSVSKAFRFQSGCGTFFSASCSEFNGNNLPKVFNSYSWYFLRYRLVKLSLNVYRLPFLQFELECWHIPSTRLQYLHNLNHVLNSLVSSVLYRLFALFLMIISDVYFSFY